MVNAVHYNYPLFLFQKLTCNTFLLITFFTTFTVYFLIAHI